MTPHPSPPVVKRDSVLVIVPTYNEAPNLAVLVERLRASVPAAHVLVVDDGSPDGTGDIADRLAASDGRVQVLHRPGKGGLGAAYVAGFRWGLRRSFDVFVQMDADGSHQPEQLPLLLARLGQADFVLGSRWVPGGAVVNWPVWRRLLSRGGTVYARLCLGIPIRDATGGYRAIRRATLEALATETVASQGYCFQIEMVWRAVVLEHTVVEAPITFVERAQGSSKMSKAIVREALWRLTAWGVKRRVARVVAGGPYLPGHRSTTAGEVGFNRRRAGRVRA